MARSHPRWKAVSDVVPETREDWLGHALEGAVHGRGQVPRLEWGPMPNMLIDPMAERKVIGDNRWTAVGVVLLCRDRKDMKCRGGCESAIKAR